MSTDNAAASSQTSPRARHPRRTLLLWLGVTFTGSIAAFLVSPVSPFTSGSPTVGIGPSVPAPVPQLTELVAGPVASASRAMPDGSQPTPGGWSRFVLVVEDIEATVASMTEAGATFRNEITSNQGRKQILVEDPSGNVVEIFQWG